MERVIFVFGRKAGALCVLGMMLLARHSVGDDSIRPEGDSRGNPSQLTSKSETGVASYYADKYHGQQTASGEAFDMNALTAAHPTYKFGTRVKVTHLENNRSVIVRINDRGPFVKGRVIDLSLAAAEELQMVKSGLAQVKLEIVE
jgi:rare lipoprotein A